MGGGRWGFECYPIKEGLKLSKLEDVILSGAAKSFRSYCRMSGGYWLHHAPEHFIEISIAIDLMNNGYNVYPNGSLRKLDDDFDDQPKPRKGDGLISNEIEFLRENPRLRPDLTIWQKSANHVEALVEIKKAWSVASLKKDADKLNESFNSTHSSKNAYLLVYTTRKNTIRTTNARNACHENFSAWAGETGFELAGEVVRKPRSENDDHYAWGFGLFRKRRPR